MDSKRMGRPPKTSREEILDAAMRADAPDLQLTRLAQDLKISVKTVYYYFPTRRALLDALTEKIVAGMDLPDVETAGDWREALQRVARWCYRLSMDQPGWFVGPTAARGVGLKLVLRIQARLVELGLTPAQAFKAFAIVGNWAKAAADSALRTEAEGGLDPANIRASLQDYADPEDVEALSALMAAIGLEEVFEDGLEVMLAGIEAKLAPD